MNCIETSHFKISARNKPPLPIKHAMILWDRFYWVIYYVANNKRAIWISAYCKIRNLEDTSREISVSFFCPFVLQNNHFLIQKLFFF